MVILYFYAIQQREEVPDAQMRYFRLASRCHAQIESIATKGSLMERFGVVLQELRLEVLRNQNYLALTSTPARAGGQGETSGTQDNDSAGQVDRSSGLDNQQLPRTSREDPALLDRPAAPAGEGQFSRDMAASATHPMEAFDSSALLHVADWGQFDSLVRPRPTNSPGASLYVADAWMIA